MVHILAPLRSESPPQKRSGQPRVRLVFGSGLLAQLANQHYTAISIPQITFRIPLINRGLIFVNCNVPSQPTSRHRTGTASNFNSQIILILSHFCCAPHAYLHRQPRRTFAKAAVCDGGIEKLPPSNPMHLLLNNSFVLQESAAVHKVYKIT